MCGSTWDLEKNEMCVCVCVCVCVYVTDYFIEKKSCLWTQDR